MVMVSLMFDDILKIDSGWWNLIVIFIVYSF